MWVLVMTEGVRARVEPLRDRFYAGRLREDAALSAIATVFGEYLTLGPAQYRRRRAQIMAMDYLKPDISGLLEAYEG